MTPQQKQSALAALRDTYKACQACSICPMAGRTVLWDGEPTAPLVIVGEAPGRREHELGRPFVGPAGEVLQAMLERAGLRRGIDVYITNTVKGWPLISSDGRRKGRTPTPQEAAHCARLILDEELRIIQPKAILAMGAVAAQHLLKTKLSIGKIRGVWGEYLGFPVIATYHPAYVLYLSGRARDRKSVV